jgi:hypothetical protein
MDLGKAHLKRKKLERSKINTLIEEKKQSLIEAEDGEASEEEAQEGEHKV